ncbi:hypothetical protein [Paenibacillus sp. FJAT-26967]|uniref:hypothetical protein n=1 Tax=Paenibacillus sp. FJAT-26967 TaxID=1729690 RepID=UPI0008386437|nr:hypothetical protein [Paenibacillus sp. FJAT-26967]
MNHKFTLTELVNKYGSKEQKQALKKNGKIPTRSFNSIIKSAREEWETVDVTGRGTKRIITCDGKRIVKAKREDRRSNNGQGQLAGEFDLCSLVIDYLIKKNNKINPMSATKWILELGIVDAKLSNAMYITRGHHIGNLQKQFTDAIEDYDKDEKDFEMLEEFIQTYLKHTKLSLVSVFNKLSKVRAIIHIKEVWGCGTDGLHRKLNKSEIKEIADLRRRLLIIHNLKGSDLFKANMKGVKEFKRAFNSNLLAQLGLQYYYEAHDCVLQDSDAGLFTTLDKLRNRGELEFALGLTEANAIIMTQMFKDKHSKRSLELAEKRQKNTSNRSDTDRIRRLKQMQHYAPMWEVLLEYFRCISYLGKQYSDIDATLI